MSDFFHSGVYLWDVSHSQVLHVVVIHFYYSTAFCCRSHSLFIQSGAEWCQGCFLFKVHPSDNAMNILAPILGLCLYVLPQGIHWEWNCWVLENLCTQLYQIIWKCFPKWSDQFTHPLVGMSVPLMPHLYQHLILLFPGAGRDPSLWYRTDVYRASAVHDNRKNSLYMSPFPSNFRDSRECLHILWIFHGCQHVKHGLHFL